MQSSAFNRNCDLHPVTFDLRPSTLDLFLQRSLNICERLKGMVANASLAAVDKQLPFGKDQVGFLYGEAIGKAIADVDDRPVFVAQPADNARLAGSAAVPTGRAAVRERGRQATPLKFQRTGKEMGAVPQFAVDPGVSQHTANDVVEAIAENVERHSMLLGKTVEPGEVGVDPDRIYQRVQLFFGRLYQGHLPFQTLSGTDQALHPRLFNLAPGGMCELAEDFIGHINIGDRPVEVAENDRAVFRDCSSSPANCHRLGNPFARRLRNVNSEL